MCVFMCVFMCVRAQVERARICMVGDRLDTDVLFGTDNGLSTVLTLSVSS